MNIGNKDVNKVNDDMDGGRNDIDGGNNGMEFLTRRLGWCAGVIVAGMIGTAVCIGCGNPNGKDMNDGVGHDPDSTAVCDSGRVQVAGRKDGKGLVRTGEAVIDSLICNMVCVEGGCFMMGATAEQGDDASDNEKPAHRVAVDDFMIGRYEVTQKVWVSVMGNNPSSFEGDNRPVESVDWDDCQVFIRKLNDRTGMHFRLPTEAEWEFAARGGRKSRGYRYAGSDEVDDVAWYAGNSGMATHDVGGKMPNELGLCDMSGNVYEWCSDEYGNYDAAMGDGQETAPVIPGRVMRGGSWFDSAGYSRVSGRGNGARDLRVYDMGLRLAL